MALASRSGELDVLNDVVQLLSWHVLRQRFLRLSDESEVNFSDILRGVCSVAPPTKLSLRSKLFLKLVSLVGKLQQQKEELELETLQVVVCLLECLQGFPELAGNRKRLTGYLTDAQCQAVLLCCRNNNEAGACSHWNKYFRGTKKKDPAWSLSSQLNLLVKTLSGDGTLSETEVKKFFRLHTFEKFQEDLLEFLQSVIETLGEPVLYKGMRCEEPFSRAVVGVKELWEGDEAMDVGSEGVIGRGEAEESVVGGGEMEGVVGGGDGKGVTVGGEGEGVTGGGEGESTTRGGEGEVVTGGGEGEGVTRGGEGEVVTGGGEGEVATGGSEKEEGRKEVAERGNEGVVEGNQNSGESCREQQSGDTQGSRSPRKRVTTTTPTRLRQIRNKGEGISQGEAIEWSSDESSEVNTPPCKLPAHHDISIRRRASLLAHPTRSRRVPWTMEEENQLFLGVEKFGIGKWTKIRSMYRFNKCRTNVDLKDKWRNLTKH